MATILSQLQKLRKNIKLSWQIKFVDREILPAQFEEKVIQSRIKCVLDTT